MADSTLHDDIRDIRTMMIDLVSGQARTEQKIDGLNDRLYKDGGGAIPVLFSKVSTLASDAAVQNGALASAITSVNNRVSNQRAYAMGAGAAAGGILMAVKGILAAKFGWHF